MRSSASPSRASFAAQQVRRGRESVLHASCDTRRYCDDAGGHRPGTQLLGAGWSRREVAEHLGLKLDTLRKAFQQGRLTEPGPLEPGATAPDKAAALQLPIATDRSTRAVEDAAAEMGTACTRPDQRSWQHSVFWMEPDPFRALPRRLLWRRALRLASPGGEWPVSTSPRLPCSVARLLQHAARDRPVGPHGAVPHQGRRAVAVPTPR